jgi:diketogulonate reductase-like aldo/keto reductase
MYRAKGENMEYRTLGKAGFEVSALGFGCGSVGGLLVRGERKEMIDTVARAIELGITYFDTAPRYGDGTSEINLGIALKEIGADVRIGTKVNLSVSDLGNIEQTVTESVNTISTNDPVQTVVFYANCSNVDTVFIAGRKVKSNGELLYSHAELERKKEQLLGSNRRLMQEAGLVKSGN